MHISALKESKFLKRADVGDGVLVTIRNLTQENVAKENEADDNKWAIHFTELDKPMILNSTNAQLIAHIVKSEETDDWTGKRITLSPREVEYQGEMVLSIRVSLQKPTAGAAPAKVINPEPDHIEGDPDSEVPF